MKMCVTVGSKARKLSKFAWYSSPGDAPAPPLATPMTLSTYSLDVF